MRAASARVRLDLACRESDSISSRTSNSNFDSYRFILQSSVLTVFTDSPGFCLRGLNRARSCDGRAPG